MALARARMAAIYKCCNNGIRQISVRRFEGGSAQTNRSCSCSCARHRGFGPSPFFHPSVMVVMFGYLCYNGSALLKADDLAKEADEEMRKMFVEEGISRESCEATISEMKQKIESGSASKTDKYILEKNEEWLQMLTKGI